MHVRFDATDFVNKRTRSLDNALFDEPVREWFNFVVQKWDAVFGVPHDVQIDFAIEVA